MIDKVLERTSDGVAVAGVSSPLWLPGLAEWSELAAMGLPILGCVWLMVQIFGYFANLANKDENDE